MPAELVLAIDAGTSAVKVAAVRPDGAVVHGVRLPLARQDPAAWWTGAVRAIRTLLATGAVDTNAIVAIGLAGRGGGTVLLGARRGLLASPGIVAAPAEPRTDVLTGPWHRLRPLVTHILSRLEAEPENARRLRYVLAVKDVIALRLTGEAVTDPASGPDTLAWPLRPLAELEFPIAALPKVRLPWQAAGTLLPKAASMVGLHAGIPVATGAHDGVAAQIGSGMVHPGDAALTLGTHAVLRVITASPSVNDRYRFYSLWGETDPRQVHGGNARMGGASASWLARAGGGTEQRLQRLEQAARPVPPGSDGVLFLPFLGGMYYPEQRSAMRGAFLGLSARHREGDLYRAVLEGVAFALRHIAESLDTMGVPAHVLRLTGGGARSALWRQVLADVLAVPLGISAAPGFEECVGAARCAWVMLGRYPDIDAAVQAGLDPVETVRPAGGATKRALDAAYRRYRAAVEAVWQLDQPPAGHH